MCEQPIHKDLQAGWVGWSVDWLVGRSVGRLIGWLVVVGSFKLLSSVVSVA